jgi:hypothetical protein
MKQFFYFIFQLAIIFSSVPSIAKACRGGENIPSNSFAQAYKSASIVFIGTVTSIDRPKDKDIVATFEIDRSWKGPKNGNLQFSMETGRSCDLEKFVEAGSRWLILADNAGERILTASHSHRLFKTKEEEQQVAELTKVK